jgi:hypothetical protein
VRLEVGAAVALEERFGDLAARRVVGADEEDADGAGHRTLPALRSAGGRDRHLEVEKLALEPVEIVALTRDRGPLVGEERGEVEVDPAALDAEPRQAAGILRPESHATEAQHQPKPGQVLVAVFAVAIGAARRLGQDALALVPADRGGGDARAARELRDSHRAVVVPAGMPQR